VSEVKATPWVDPLFEVHYSSLNTMPFFRGIRLLGVAGAVASAALSACDDPLNLVQATAVNTVDTATIYALRGTAVVLPSGYDLPNEAPARTDVVAFDFAFDLDGAGQPLIYPAGALGLTRGPGVQKLGEGFDAVQSAPLTGYNDSLAVAVTAGDVFVVRSRPYIVGCELTGELPRYGKFRIIGVDPALRSLTLETLVNRNCGYRSLQPGLPTT
jgi:hypothetical protein